jgi:hypothetical protein
MLMEGCHRSCALYLLDPPKFELRTVVVAVDAGRPVYNDPRLRVSRAESRTNVVHWWGLASSSGKSRWEGEGW